MVAPLSWACAQDAAAGCEKVTKAKPREWLVILSRMTCACRGPAVRGDCQCHAAAQMSTPAETGCKSAIRAKPHMIGEETIDVWYDEQLNRTSRYTCESCQIMCE